jgi:hypothetical protein
VFRIAIIDAICMALEAGAIIEVGDIVAAAADAGVTGTTLVELQQCLLDIFGSDGDGL